MKRLSGGPSSVNDVEYSHQALKKARPYAAVIAESQLYPAAMGRVKSMLLCVCVMATHWWILDSRGSNIRRKKVAETSNSNCAPGGLNGFSHIFSEFRYS